MESIFIRLLNMSINASWLVLGIVAGRLIFKKAPKSIIVALWSTVALRLICPFSFESVLSLLPSAQTVPPDIVYSPTPSVSTGLPLFNSVVNPIITESFAPNPGDSANPLQIVTFIASAIWLIGVTAMLLYALVSYTKIRLKVREAAQLRDNVSLCDSIATPFILGIIKPQIYLPSDMAQEDMEYVIAHEKAHLKRHDNFWKPFGFLLLSIYWFNPVLWVAYVLLCRDIEFACDERVIRDMDTEHRKAYSYVLINCSAPVKAVTACPLAFGEVGVKGRIKSVLSYKKPAFWLIVAALLACVAISVAFLTNPKSTDAPRADDIGNLITLDRGSQLDGLSVEITSVELSEPSPFISVKWKNKSQHDIIFGEEFYIYYNTNGNNGYGGWEDCRNNKDFAWNLIGYYLSPLINGLDMAQPGVYRFETSCSIEGKPNEDYKVWIEFELKAAVDGVSVHLLELTEQVFVSSMYSFVSSMSNVSNYRLVNGMNLQEIRTDGIIVDVGFLLSVFSVMGIFTYYNTFSCWGNTAIAKIGLGKRKKEDGKFLHFLDRATTKCLRGITESASVSMSANLFTFPLVGYFFGSIPVLFMLSNIVILPYMMFIFIFLIIITLFCQITTLWGGVQVMQYLLLPLRSWTGFIGSISWANLDIGLSAFFIVLWLVGAIMSSKYIFTNRKVKITAVALWSAIFIALVVLCLV